MVSEAVTIANSGDPGKVILIWLQTGVYGGLRTEQASPEGQPTGTSKSLTRCHQQQPRRVSDFPHVRFF